MAMLGENAIYKIGNQKFPYDAVSYYELLLTISDQEETIKILQAKVDKHEGNGKA
jgi:hypothetical protein